MLEPTEGDAVHHEFGPLGEHITAFIDALGNLTVNEVKDLAAAWGATEDSPRVTARDVAWDAAWPTTRGTAWEVAEGSAVGSVWPAIQGAARAIPTLNTVIDRAWEHAETIAKEN